MPTLKQLIPLLKNINSKTDLYLLNAGEEENVVSFDNIKQIVLKLTSTDREIKTKSLFSFFEEEIKRLKSQDRLGYAETYQSTLNCIKRFTNEKDYAFINIQLDFLRKFEAHLIE